MQGGALIALSDSCRVRDSRQALRRPLGIILMAMTNEQWTVRTGAAALATCIVRTLQQSDPTFEERFLKHLDDAYHQFRDDSDAVGADGKPRDVIGVLEMLTWTNELLTGWNPVVGQGRPLLK